MVRSAAAASMLALVLSISACGEPSSPSAGGRYGTTESPKTAASGTTAAQPEASIASKRASTAAMNGRGELKDSGGSSDDGYGTRNNMPLKVTMSATCLRRGDRMEVVVVTSKGAQVGFAAAYSDNDAFPDIFWVRGEANPTGTATWAFVIKPTTPLGEGWLEVVAAKKPDKGASFEGQFRIAQSC